MSTKVGSTVNIGIWGPVISVPWNKVYSVDAGSRDPNYPSRIICPARGNYLFSADLWYFPVVPLPSLKIGMVRSGNVWICEIVHQDPQIYVAQHVGLSAPIQYGMNAGEYAEVCFMPMMPGPAAQIVIHNDPDNPGITAPYFQYIRVY